MNKLFLIFCALFTFAMVYFIYLEIHNAPKEIYELIKQQPRSKYIHNIEIKCGISPNDALWTTAMMKISDCIDKVELVKIKIGKSIYYIPRDGRHYEITYKGLINE